MEFVENAKIETSDFFYDLIDGGYIRPQDVLINQKDIDAVNNAIKTIKDFRDCLEKNGIIEYE